MIAASPNWKTILGLNARNRLFVYRKNHRLDMRTANDKLLARRRLEENGIPMPELLGVIETVAQVSRTVRSLYRGDRVVVLKPNWGSGGRGILFLRPDSDGRSNGSEQEIRSVERHCRTILSGEFSLRSGMDTVIIEERVESHPDMLVLNDEGSPDVRILCVDGRPILAMARVPTRLSDGKANLHQGALGVGIEMESGRGKCATWKNRLVSVHPDTGRPVDSLLLPGWKEILKVAESACRAIGLGYAGVDIMVDSEKGPRVLEVNARPGLAIQLANRCPLLPVLQPERFVRNGEIQ